MRILCSGTPIPCSRAQILAPGHESCSPGDEFCAPGQELVSLGHEFCAPGYKFCATRYEFSAHTTQAQPASLRAYGHLSLQARGRALVGCAKRKRLPKRVFPTKCRSCSGQVFPSSTVKRKLFHQGHHEREVSHGQWWRHQKKTKAKVKGKKIFQHNLINWSNLNLGKEALTQM